MKVNCIIGAGQLGSRHLQGLLKYPLTQSIFILDPSEQSLELAKKRSTEVSHFHTLTFTSDWSILPKNLDLVIIATSSNVREQVIDKLLREFKVEFLILEKILFQDLEAYDKVGSLLGIRKVPTWVNHPRRMFKDYQILNKNLSADSSNRVFTALGGNWGLGCNALHLIDLFVYLDGSNVASLNFDWLDDTLLESKRSGYVEFTGTIRGILYSNNKFFISSLPGQISALTVTVESTYNRWIIQEGGTPQVLHFSADNNFKYSSTSFESEFQSSLTTTLAKNLFENGHCNLPTYAEACHSHKPFVEGLLQKFNQLTGQNSKACPIT
jgi:hypothetical protein